ncbi:unnamed protein product [Callosobruchus maculatus]|uniref:Uncharacterized protein n=1 Tax=Callosobruchus maculatus TaxID=64391 RepID=A0A653BK83_CALMS|nr:unnamed protein product [Callosobruchus maculatus]
MAGWSTLLPITVRTTTGLKVAINTTDSAQVPQFWGIRPISTLTTTLGDTCRNLGDLRRQSLSKARTASTSTTERYRQNTACGSVATVPRA